MYRYALAVHQQLLEISLSEGGLSRLIVKDNGTGISEHDALLICRRNVTSKISSIDDLSSLATFGFRGEALNSIASLCSAFYILTRQEASEVGFKYKFNASTQTMEKIHTLPLDVPFK